MRHLFSLRFLFSLLSFALVISTAPVQAELPGDSATNASEKEEKASLSVDEDVEYDVVVYGGTSAGVIAAVQAKKMGKTAIIVAPEKHLGGLSSSGLGATDSGNRDVIGGLSRDFYHRLWQHYQDESVWTHQPMPKEKGIPGQGGRGIDNATQTMWVFEPSAAEQVFEDLIHEYEIPVVREAYLDREAGVHKEDVKIRSIQTLSGCKIKGKMFIDATYEGDLFAAAGVSYTTGRESNTQYGETLNGRQVGNAIHHQFAGHVDPYIERGNPSSGLLPMVNPPLEGKDGDADTKIQAYCFRMCLTNAPENRVEIEKPANYDERDYELLFRSIEAGQKAFCTFSPMPNAKTDSNNNLAVSTDFIGQNYTWPDGSYTERQSMYKKHLAWQQGLMWTLRNHPRVPEAIRREFEPWGLSKDEFSDNGHWPYILYIREGRRMIGDFVVSERHLRRIDPTPRPVGMGSYNMDSHHIQRHVMIGEDGVATVRNEGDVQVNPGGPYPIDYGALLPKKTECENLLVPVCVSCTHIAYGSIRMEPVFMLLGQSAATAACLSLESRIAPQDLPYDQLRERLITDGQVLSWEPQPPKVDVDSQKLTGVVMDNRDAKKIGTWISATSIRPFVDTDYLHDANESKGEKSVVFEMTVPKSGEYDVQLAYSTHSNRATNIPIEINTGDQKNMVMVNERIAPPIDHLFVSLGTISVEKTATITIGTQDTDGYVIVDAIRLIAQ